MRLRNMDVAVMCLSLNIPLHFVLPLAPPAESVHCVCICTKTLYMSNLLVSDFFLPVPPNGLVVYCGTIVTEEGKEKKVNIDFEPFKPINTSLYLCDNKFHTEVRAVVCFCVYIQYFSCTEDSWDGNFSFGILHVLCHTLMIHSSLTL